MAPPSPRQFIKLFQGKPSLFNNCPKSPFGYFFVVGDNETTVGIYDLSKNDVTAFLAVSFITHLRQSGNNLSA
jgi:uncharacterized protein (DUF2237 family)